MMPPTTPIDTIAMSEGGSAMMPRVEVYYVGNGVRSSQVAMPVEDIKVIGTSAERLLSPSVSLSVMGLGPRVE